LPPGLCELLDRIVALFDLFAQDVFFFDIFDAFDLHILVFWGSNWLFWALVFAVVAAGSTRSRLLDRLFRPPFWSAGMRFG